LLGGPPFAMSRQSAMEDMFKNAAALGMLQQEKPPYQHGLLERKDVTQMLASGGNEEGCFLVRENKRKQGSYVLSVCQHGAPQHYVIQVNNGTYGIDDGPRKKSLAELINYYRFDPTSPTKLTTPICRAGSSMEAWEAKLAGGGSGSAPPAIPSRAGRGGQAPAPVAVNMENIYGNIAPEAVVEVPKAPAPAPLNKKSPPAPSSSGVAASEVPPPGSYRIAADNNIVKDFLKLQAEVDAIELDEASDDDEDFDPDNLMAQQFEHEAFLTEKLNVWWLNKMLQRLNKDKTVTNVRASVKDAVLLIQILELLAKEMPTQAVSLQKAAKVKEGTSLKPPKYAKMARMDVQLRDNWASIVRYMRNLGIQVDNVKVAYQKSNRKEVDLNEDVEEIKVGLDPIQLFNLDRRELMKIFSKIMVYENKLINTR